MVFQTRPRFFCTCGSTVRRRKGGMELYASSLDLRSVNGVGGMDVLHHLMPQICIGIGSLSAYGKVMSLLWIIWLMVGPTYNSMRGFTNRVFSFNTDYGTERSIVDYPDCLGFFLRYINVQVPTNAEVQEFLFPSAVANPGWFHFWDSVVRAALCSLPWFPAWLQMSSVLKGSHTSLYDLFQSYIFCMHDLRNPVDYQRESF